MITSAPWGLVEGRGPDGPKNSGGRPGRAGDSVEHMFVSVADLRPGAGRAPGGDPAQRDSARAALAHLAERARPVTSSRSRLLPVAPPLAGLFPDGALQRGSTIAVTGDPLGDDPGPGVVSMAMALVAAASAAGSWCAFAGVGDLGAVSAHDLGIDLERLSLVPRPGVAWAEVTGALLDGVDMVVLHPPFPPRPAMVRRLVAKARERRSVLMVLPGRAGWPEHPDLRLEVGRLRWDGAGTGEGYLRRRRLTVTAAGRRASGRPRRCDLWLPTAAGGVAGVTDISEVA